MWKRIKHLFNYRELFFIFVWRDFNIRYKQTILGVAWAIIQPLSFMLLFTFIFAYAMQVKVSSYPSPVFFYTGLLPWTFFASSITYSLQSITGNHYLLRKIYFPRIILPVTGVIMALIDFFIATSIFFILLVFYKIPLSITALWYLPLLLLLLLLTLGLSFMLSILNVYYRDVGLVSSFFIQVLFFSTPILYSVQKVSPFLKSVIYMNPLTFIIENMRACLLDKKPVPEGQFFIMLLVLALFLCLSFKFFENTEREISDVL